MNFQKNFVALFLGYPESLQSIFPIYGIYWKTLTKIAFFGFPLRSFHVLSIQNQRPGVNYWICGSIITEGF